MSTKPINVVVESKRVQGLRVVRYVYVSVSRVRVGGLEAALRVDWMMS